jgi:hypothetical protein
MTDFQRKGSKGSEFDILKIGDTMNLTDQQKKIMDTQDKVRDGFYNEAFASLDGDRDGFVTMDEMMGSMAMLTDIFTDPELRAKIYELDFTGSLKKEGKIDEGNYVAVMADMVRKNKTSVRRGTNDAKGWFASYSCFEMMGFTLDAVLINARVPYLTEAQLKDIHKELQPMLDKIGYKLDDVMVKDNHNNCQYRWAYDKYQPQMYQW